MPVLSTVQNLALIFFPQSDKTGLRCTSQLGKGSKDLEIRIFGIRSVHFPELLKKYFLFTIGKPST
ncbi:hypothetical protein NIES2098_04400 [Calothrix sp. NIES-2098]|nr:hypothetical protein NIES2098_04400 [Calothrix sp. NIES-2098]